MTPHGLAGRSTAGRRPWRPLVPLIVPVVVSAVVPAAGCRSDFNQQLLERELRYQEDQIYQLQDELAEKCARLDRVAGENASLRRQLGVSDGDPATSSRGRRSRAPAVPPAVTVPPAIEVPEAGPLPAPRAGGPPAELAPPTLEGVPPLPSEPGGAVPEAGVGEGLSLPPATTSVDPSARPIVAAAGEPAAGATEPALVRMSFDEAADDDRPVRLAVNPAGSSTVDADGDGRGDGLSLAIEPRTAGERLTAVSGDLTITACDAAAPPGASPLANWTVPGSEALARFRPTGRRRGIILDLPWQGTVPAGSHVRVRVETATPAGPIEVEALVPAR